MSIIEGRILNPPPLVFGSNSDWQHVITPSDGTWRIGRGLRFAAPAVLTTWAVAVFGDPTYFPIHTVGMFVKNVLTACVNLGMEISERNIADYIVYAPRVGPDTVEMTLRMADERARSFVPSMPGHPHGPHGPHPHHPSHQHPGFMYDARGNPIWNGNGPSPAGGAAATGGGYGGMVGYAPPVVPQVAQLVICILAQKNSVGFRLINLLFGNCPCSSSFFLL
jgi:hypothetical protein